MVENVSDTVTREALLLKLKYFKNKFRSKSEESQNIEAQENLQYSYKKEMCVTD